MAHAVFNGFLGFSKSVQSGYILIIREPIHNALQKEVVTHRIAVWGKIAQAIAPHLIRNTRFELTCSISYSKAGDKYFTNFTVTAWKVIPTPMKKPRAQEEPQDDDWFTPDVNQRCTSEDRRYEGFDTRSA